MGKQTYILRLDEELARRVVDLINRPDSGYNSIEEIVTVALLNQLSAEPGIDQESKNVPAAELPELLAVPGTNSAPIVKRSVPSEEPLFLLSNRLSPMKVAVRVLANLARDNRNWPYVSVFQQQAARAARDLGLRIRSEDDAGGAPAEARRWIAYPVAPNVEPALQRFIGSFTMEVVGTGVTGPLALLGLANVTGDDKRAALTDAGWRLAAAPSPLLDNAEGSTLSEEERTIFREQIGAAPGERRVVMEFLGICKRAAGLQRRISELFTARHPEWSANLTNANRAAIMGRLAELGLIEIGGRGPSAVIRILAPAEEFLPHVA